MVAQLNIFTDTQLLDYGTMTEWELAARHMVARERKHLEVCREIERVVVAKRKDIKLLTKIKYYQPVGKE